MSTFYSIVKSLWTNSIVFKSVEGKINERFQAN